MQNRIKKAGALLAVLAGSFVASAPAHALAVKGSWDPLVGASLPGVYWEGSATFVFPETTTGCGGPDALTGAINCFVGGYYVQDAKVTLRSGSGSTLKTETIAWERDDLTPVTGMGFTDGLLSSVQSASPAPLPSPFGPLSSFFYMRPADLTGAVNDLFYALSFFSTSLSTGIQAKLSFATCDPWGTDTVKIDGVEYYMVEAKKCHDFASSDSLTFPAVVRGDGILSPVSEPGTSMLLLAGLAAAGFMARRRRKS